MVVLTADVFQLFIKKKISLSFCRSACVTLNSSFSMIAKVARGREPGIYGSGRVWADGWDVFLCAPSRGGRGRRAAAAFVVCSGWGGFP